MLLTRFQSNIRCLNKILELKNRFNLSSCSFSFQHRLLSSSTTTNDKSHDDSSGDGHSKTTKELLDESASFTADEEAGGSDVWGSHTYGPEKKHILRSQRHHPEIKGIDPAETSVFLFPGQGTQYVGMARNLVKYAGVKELYEIASEILGYNLLKLSLEGPMDELSRTEKQQPAIFVASLAAVERMREESPMQLENCIACAGFSVGELTALTFAGSLKFDDAIRLLQIRGEAMQIASEMTPSGMMTVFFGADSRLSFACKVAREYCVKNGIENAECGVANYLYPHCKVVAGNEEALDFLVRHKDEFRLRRLKRISVSGAFHTTIMKPAADVFREALKNVEFEKPQISVYSNYHAKCYRNDTDIKRILPKQITGPVRWEQILHGLYERKVGQNFPVTFECGPGKSLKTILKMVNEKAFATCNNIQA